jgi:hypothetical protein
VPRALPGSPCSRARAGLVAVAEAGVAGFEADFAA